MASGDRLEGRLQIGEGFHAIDLRGGDQGGDAGPGATAFVVAGEERILSRQGDRADQVLDGVGVDLDAAVMQEGLQTGPLAMDVGQLLAHPTDARLYDKARRQLVALAIEAGIKLRQNYNRLAPRLAMQAGRYAHARQFKRMRKALKKLKGYTGRVLRDLRRQLDAIPEGPLRECVLDMLVLVGRLLHQGPKSKGKIYALHEPEVDCISKGKARKRYEFGTKVSLATTIDEGFIVGMRSMPGNPYDGHTLPEALEQVEILTGQTPALAVVDRGYRGHGVTRTQVLISGTRRGLTPALKRLLRRRSAIEPEIGHMKTDGRLSRCPLKGTFGDAIFAVLCGCGHNIRKILANLRALLALLITTIAAIMNAPMPEARRRNRQNNGSEHCSA